MSGNVRIGHKHGFFFKDFIYCAHFGSTHTKKISFIYLRVRVRGHEQEGGVEGEGKADSPLSRESDVGLNPRTLGS